jgi:hypothetical protein
MIQLPPIIKPVMIFVKQLNNINYMIEIDFEDTVYILKNRLFAKCGVSTNKQRIIFFGKEIKEGKPCIDIKEFSKEGLIHLVILHP